MTSPIRFLHVLAFAAGALALTNAAAEEITFSNWNALNGSYVDGGPTAPGFTGAAVGSLYATFDAVTLNVGDRLSFTGNVALTGIPTSTAISGNNFKWGLFDNNGSTNQDNWLGWIAGMPGNTAANASADNGRMYQKLSTQPGNFYSGGNDNLTIRASNTSGGVALTSDTYSLSFTVMRVDAGLQISWSMIGQSPDNAYNLSGTYLAPNAQVETWTFSRIGLSSQTGGFGGKSTGMQYSDLALEFTPAIPEPATSAALIGAILAGAVIASRRRK